jgi:methionyl aminopeptidase
MTFQARLEAARRAAAVHRGVRRHVQESLLHVGSDLNDVAEELEATTKAMVDAEGLKRGIAFPTGLSLNSCAAHDSPNPRDAPRRLRFSDVLKVDFGVHVDGVIIDCAFTWAPDPKWEQLLAGVQAATETGIREAGVDARLCDIGAAIQETMESYEVNGEAIKPIRNLNGHSIEPYLIHAGKSVPSVKGTSESVIMEEGEFFAIETFGSVGGRGEIHELEGDAACSHYMREFNPPRVPLRLPASKDLLRRINQNFGSLAFSKRQLERDAGASRYLMPLRELVASGVVESYPPLMEKSGARVAQFEHTIALKPTGKEVLSRGEDF